ncbi:MAG: glycosyltransferase [Hyphomicrobiaceae bacterium]|nr:MAG: glycosyltransferase [Hyphomicrobiaceae bacterium]
MAMHPDARSGPVGHRASSDPIPAGILARMRGVGQRVRAQHTLPADAHEYAFLVGRLIDRGTLQRAEAEASQAGVPTHAVLLAAGWVSPFDYTSALAQHLGVAAAFWAIEIDASEAEEAELQSGHGLQAQVAGRHCRVLPATDAAPDALRRQIAALRNEGTTVVLAPRFCIDAAREVHLRDRRIDRAIRGLLRERTASSAGAPVWTWQLVAGVAIVGLTIGGFAVVPQATFAAMTGVIALPFLCVTLLRLVALREVLSGAHRRTRENSPEAPRLPDDQLPVYSVLVPLLREGNVLPGLVQSLRTLDYPQAKLEVFLVLEAADTETQAAVLALELPGNFRALVVPDQAPRTKPKALNYALQFARGDYVVVYDAEDRPQPDQLRRALEVFRRAPADLTCVQAQLNIYNPRQSWLARQFTIEYSALFDAILPALERLRLPVPLGGTSNHFPRITLATLGAWDPFNVTEDADLGIRLARQGYRTAVLSSTTWEEAPVAFGTWLRQRTRWLKGWMQTYLVHTRHIWRLNAELGLPAAIGFHALMGGLILSALVHPWFYVLLAYHALTGTLFAPAETAVGTAFWAIAGVNLGIGYVVSIAVGMLSVWRRGRPGLAMFALLLPVYWMLISLAAYRATYQFVRAPYLWEKTDHGMGRR